MENSNNLFSNTPDSVFSYLAQTYNKPGNTGNFRAQQAASGQSDYGASPLFTQAQIEAGRTSGHLGTKLFLQTYSPSITVSNDGRIKVNAPQSFLDSSYYRQQVRPMLDSYIGTNVTNQEDMAKMKAAIQEQFNAAVGSWTYKVSAEEAYGGQMSDDEANRVININAAVAQANNGETESLENIMVPVVLGTEDINYDSGLFGIMGNNRGTWTTGLGDDEQSVIEFLDRFNSWNDASKSLYVDSLVNTVNSKNGNVYLKARAQGLIDLLTAANENLNDYRGMLNADTSTKIYNVFSRFSNKLQSGLVGGTFQSIAGVDDRDREQLNDMYTNLSGASNWAWTGDVAGTVVNLVPEMILGGWIGKGANAIFGVTKAVQAGEKVSRVRNGLATIFGGGYSAGKATTAAGKLANAWRTLDPVGSVAMGAWGAAVTPKDDGYGSDDFVWDMIGNAGFYGAMKGLGAGARALGKTRPGRFVNRQLNRIAIKATGSKLGRKLSTIASTPGEAKSRLEARIADDKASRDYLKRRREARKAGEVFSEKENIGYNYMKNENELAFKRQKRQIQEYRQKQADKIRRKYARRAGLSPTGESMATQAAPEDGFNISQEEAAQQDLANAPTGQVDDAARDTIQSVDQYLDGITNDTASVVRPSSSPEQVSDTITTSPEGEAPSPTGTNIPQPATDGGVGEGAPNASDTSPVSANSSPNPEMVQQDPNIDNTKVKDTSVRNQVDAETAPERISIDTIDQKMSNDPDLYGEKEITESVDPETGERLRVQSAMPKNVADWNNDTTLLARFEAAQRLDDIAKKLEAGGTRASLTPEERAFYDQYVRNSYTGRIPSSLPNSGPNSRKNLDKATKIVRDRLANNPISKDPQARALARQQRSIIQRLTNKIQDAIEAAGLSRNHNIHILRNNPAYADYLRMEPISVHSTTSTARGGTRTTNWMKIARTDYYDPLTTLNNQIRGYENGLYIQTQKKVQSIMSQNGGASVHQSAQAIEQMDNTINATVNQMKDTLDEAMAENPSMNFDNVDDMFNYTSVETVEELDSRVATARGENITASTLISDTKLGQDLQNDLSVDSPTSKFRQENPNAFVQDSFTVDGMDDSQALKAAKDYQDTQAVAANTNNLFALNASKINVVNMSSESGNAYITASINSMPDSLVEQMSTEQRGIFEDIKFNRPGADLSAIQSIPVLRNYLEINGIHGIRTANGAFVQISPNARIYNTSVNEDTIARRLNSTSNSKNDMENAIGDSTDMLIENAKNKLFQDEKVYSDTILSAAGNGNISPDTTAVVLINQSGDLKRSMADKLYESSNNGYKAYEGTVQSVVGTNNPELMPSGWKPGDKPLTRQDFLDQAKRNKDGNTNKRDLKKWEKRWDKFDSLCKDSGYIQAAKGLNNRSGGWTRDDFREYVDKYIQNKADEMVRFDSLPPQQQQNIRIVSESCSEIEATGGKSHRDLKKTIVDQNQSQRNLTDSEQEAEGRVLSEASSEVESDATTNSQANMQEQRQSNRSASKTKWNDNKVSSVTSPSPNSGGGENSTLAGNKFTTEAVKADSGGSKSYGPANSFLGTANRFVNNTFRTFTTTLNPLSWYKNIARDGGMAFVGAGVVPQDWLKTSIENPVGYWINSPDFYNPLVETFNGDTEAANEYLLNVLENLKSPLGGVTESSLYHGSPGEGGNSITRACNKAVNILETPANFMEQAQRQVIGTTTLTDLIKRGYDPEYAATAAVFYSRVTTTDFNMGMGQLERFRHSAPYVASAINGTRSFMRLLAVDPVGVSLRIACGVLTPIYYCTLSNLTDPNKRARYEQISETDKEANLIFIDKTGSAIFIPIPQELYGFTNTARRFAERIYSDNPETVTKIAFDGALDLFPFDISWVSDAVYGTDEFGNSIDIMDTVVRGAATTVSSVTPIIGQLFYEQATGRDMYTGAELSQSADTESPVYNAIANKFPNLFPTGTTAEKRESIGRIQSAISGVFGTMGDWLVNSVDQTLGASEKEAGGKSFRDSVAQTIAGERSYDAASQKFFSAIDSLENQKEKLKNKLSDIDQKMIDVESDEDKQKLQQDRQKLIDEYSKTVGDTMNKWGRMFKITGGINTSRKNQIVNLLNLGSEDPTGRGTYGSYYGEEASDADRQEYYDALQRYEDIGLEDPTAPIMAYRDSSGAWQTTKPGIAIQNAINRSYGAPKQMQYDVEQAISRKNADGKTLWDVRSDFKQQIDALYDQAEANGTKPDYDAIADLQYQFIDYFDQTMQPIIDQYGEFVFTNNDVINDLRGLLNNMIPTETYQKDKYGRFRSMPTMDVDLWKWMQNHYGIGYGNTDNAPSDQEVAVAVNRINEALQNGQLAQAKALARRINQRIGSGNLYADSSDMNMISSVLGY